MKLYRNKQKKEFKGNSLKKKKKKKKRRTENKGYITLEMYSRIYGNNFVPL